jgi:hypothetical protein
MEFSNTAVMANRLVGDIPSLVASTFTKDQISALDAALLKQYGYKKHPLDMRMRFKLGTKRFYAVFLVGQEKRPERRSYEMSSLGNALTYLVFAGLIALQIVFFYKIS